MVNRSAIVLALVLAGCGGKVAEPVDTMGPDPAPPPQERPGLDPLPPAPGCRVSFRSDVMPILVERSCAQSQCHGGPVARNLPLIDATSPAATWSDMRSFTLSTGKPYFVQSSSDPNDSGMHCHLRGECGVSMIPLMGGNGLLARESLTIDTWLSCGARDN